MAERVKPWRWVVPRTTDSDNLDLMNATRKAIEEFPPYKSRFRVSEIVGDGRNVPPESSGIMLYFGAWKIPSRYSHHRNTHYVNPNYKDLRMYSDAAVRCGCGAWVVYSSVDEKNRSWVMEHDEECDPSQRKQARYRLKKRRKRIIRESCIDAYMDTNQLAKRLGYTDRRQIHMYCCRKDLPSVGDLRLEGRKRMTKTWIELMDRGRSASEIAEAFGVSEATVYTNRRKYGPE